MEQKALLIVSETRRYLLLTVTLWSFGTRTLHLHIITMTNTNLADIAACAQKILDAIGPCSVSQPRLSGKGQLPDLPLVDFRDSLEQPVYAHLAMSIRDRVSELATQALKQYRCQALDRYQRVADNIYSTEQFGLSDVEGESRLRGAFERSYEGYTNKIRSLIRKTASQHWPSAVINGRGGFGDASTPLPSKANNSANPPNLRNSLQLHKIPLINRNRSSRKVDITGDSSSTSKPLYFIHAHS